MKSGINDETEPQACNNRGAPVLFMIIVPEITWRSEGCYKFQVSTDS